MYMKYSVTDNFGGRIDFEPNYSSLEDSAFQHDSICIGITDTNTGNEECVGLSIEQAQEFIDRLQIMINELRKIKGEM